MANAFAKVVLERQAFYWLGTVRKILFLLIVLVPPFFFRRERAIFCVHDPDAHFGGLIFLHGSMDFF